MKAKLILSLLMGSDPAHPLTASPTPPPPPLLYPTALPSLLTHPKLSATLEP